MNKPTIAIFSAFYAPWESGAERFVRELVYQLGERYHFVLFTSRNSRKVPAREDLKQFTLIRLGLGTKFDKWLFPVLAAVAATRVKPKLVHAVMESYAGIALLLFRALNWKTPTVLTLQSGDLDDQKKQRKIPYFLWKLIHSTPTHITAISRYLAQRAKKLGAREDRVSIIHNGVDLAEIKPLMERAHTRVPFRIVSIGRLSWEKGHEYLISALPLIKKEFPLAHLVLVGGGAEEQKLRQLTHVLDLNSSVFFRGALPHLRAMGEAAQAEVFVGPSLAEGLGIVFLEAQALGIPVVGTYVGGIPDAIEHGVTGLLVPPKDPSAIAEAVMKIFRDVDLRSRFNKNTKERIENFSWNKITESVSSLYHRYL